MGARVVMDDQGRLVLPQAVRDRLNLRGEAVLGVEVVGERIELTPMDTGAPVIVRRETGIPTLRGTGRVVDAAAAVVADRADRELQLSQRLDSRRKE